MKEIILDRLRKVENLEQRQMLKEIVNGVFTNLIEYQEEMNQKLEERVFNEIENEENQFDIYVAVCSKDDVDLLPKSLYPMISSDLVPQVVTSQYLLEQAKNKVPVTLFSLFLQADLMELDVLVNANRNFKGYLKTTNGQYEITVYLRQNTTYLQAIENLYQSFQMNGIPWKTVHHPYAHRFFDVLLVDHPPLSEKEEITSFKIDFEEFEDKKHLDKLPVWNVEKLMLKSIGFPVPALDKVNFEHILSLHKPGVQHGYLIDIVEESIRYTKRSENELTIVSAQESSSTWDVLKVTKVEEQKIEGLAYELVSNRRNHHFMNRYVNHTALSVKTKSEIIRMVNSFDMSSWMELVDVTITEDDQGATITYDANPFIGNEINQKNNQKIMLLQFKAQQKQDFIANDRMSFFVSEIQRHFPEYQCKGAWA